MNQAAIVPCGGRSMRMGIDKAGLPFGSQTMLARVVERLSSVVSTVVLVAARGQQLPPVTDKVGIVVAYDVLPNQGPLAAIAAGLSALPSAYDKAFVTSCDAPLLVPAFVERFFMLLDPEYDIVVPTHQGRWQPLAGVYRRSVLGVAEQLLCNDHRSLQGLLERCLTRFIPCEAWHDVDPDCHSLLNCNTPADYETALRLAGFDPEV